MSEATVVGVVGAGTMGAGIAQVAATGGHPVRLYAAAPGVAATARAGLAGRIDRLAEKGTLTPAAAAAAKARITVVDDLAGMAPCGVVVEAVVEDLTVKHAVFTMLEQHCAPDAILASNTSSIPIARIAQALKQRGRVAGMLFFNPVPVMRLVEIISGPDTEPAVADRLSVLGERFGRVPVKVKDAPGFLVNLGGRSFTTEGLALVHEGVATPEQVDQVMRLLPFPHGSVRADGPDRDRREPPGVGDRLAGLLRRSAPAHHALPLLDARGGPPRPQDGQGHFAYDAKGVRTPGAVPELPAGCAGRARRAARRLGGAGRPGGGRRHHRPRRRREPAAGGAGRRGLHRGRGPPGVDHRRLVAVDLACDTTRRVTLMAAPGADPAIGGGRRASSPTGGDRDWAIAGLHPAAPARDDRQPRLRDGADRLAAPADIDTAMQLGLNYPQGPLAMADQMGVAAVHGILRHLQEATGDDRYRPSLWLRRRAMLGLPAATPA
jgi:3-hydroxybutyryl-CoA dehydrogenase